MTDIVAVANQKGGVAKTTTVHSLGVASAQLGRRVLLVDLDPQACLTYSLGFDPDRVERSLHDVFVQRAEMADIILSIPEVEGLDLAPATIDLAGSEVHLLTRTGREHVLARGLAPVLERYDLVLIDCPPSLGVLTINGLTAAHSVVIPLQCEALSHRGVGQLMETIEDVRAFANADLAVRGIIATMYDSRTKHSRTIVEEVEERYGIPVLQPPVRKSIRFAEAPAQGKSILQHAPTSAGAVAYRHLAQVLMAPSGSTVDALAETVGNPVQVGSGIPTGFDVFADDPATNVPLGAVVHPVDARGEPERFDPADGAGGQSVQSDDGNLAPSSVVETA